MTNSLPPPGRRRLLGLMSALPASARGPLSSSPLSSSKLGARFAAADQPRIPSATFPAGATVLVAGPVGGQLTQWGRLMAPGLGRSLPPEGGQPLCPCPEVAEVPARIHHPLAVSGAGEARWIGAAFLTG